MSPKCSPIRSHRHRARCSAAWRAAADGWRDDLHPRTIRYWADDLQVLFGLVHSGLALAYLPREVARDAGLVEVAVGDAGFASIEQVRLVWNRTTAPQ